MQIRIPKNPLREYIFFFSISATVLAVVFAITMLPDAFSFYNNAHLVDATVTGKNCPNHAAVYVTYNVNGKFYSPLAELGDRCEQAQVGSHIDLWIDATNPQIVFEDSPSAHLTDALEGVPVLAFGMSLMVALLCMRVRRSQ